MGFTQTHAQDWTLPLPLPVTLLLLVLATELAYRLLRRLASVPRVPKEERLLLEDIRRLRKEAEHLITPDTFAQSAKLARLANTKEKQLQQLRSKASAKPVSALISSVAPGVLQGVLRILAVASCWDRPVVVLPLDLAEPFGTLLALPHGTKWHGGGAVSVVVWLFCASHVASFFLDVLML